MPFGVGFILLLLVVGGIAAYWGDHVGKVVGKKRLTILGIRPKYTSRIVAVSTGVVIVLFTLGTLIFASHSVRQALFGLEELQGRVQHLSAEVTEFEEKRIELENRNTVLTMENERLLDRNAELVLRNEDLAEQNDRLMKVSERLGRETSRLESEKLVLETDKIQLSDEVTQLQNQVEVVRLELDQAREQLAGVEESLEFVRFLGEQFWNVAQTLYEAEFVVHVGDVLHTFLVDLSHGPRQIIDDIEQGMATAELALLGHGFTRQGSNSVIRLDRAYSLDGEVISFSGSEVLGQMADTLMQWADTGLDRIIVQLSAITNARTDDPVFADFRFVIDEVVFSEGDVLATKVFDPAVSRGRLMEEVMSFLQVEISALARGNLLPLDGDYGQVSLSEVYLAVESISTYDAPVQMSVVAASDIWAHESLSVQFSFDEVQDAA